MAFFKSRKGGDEQSTAPITSESVEVMRRRARHRLVGAAVLVLIGVVGFPLLFDSQPRPIAVDIPIDIPDKGKVRSLGAPVLPPATQASGVIIEEREESAISAVSTPKLASTDATAVTGKPEVNKPAAKSADKAGEKLPQAPIKPAGGTKAQTLLERKKAADPKTAPHKADDKAAAVSGRFVVQVGAYNEPAKLQEARSKVEKAGFKTYTQVVGAKDSQRTRVRIGPFSTKVDAQKAADKLKKMSLPAAILEI